MRLTINKSVLWRLSLGLLVILCSSPLHAGPITYGYTGVLNSTITVGTSSIPAGSAFSGELSYDLSEAGVVTPYNGGTQSVFDFNSLALTINGQTAVESHGNLGLYNNVISDSGVPSGDSFYTFVPGDNSGPGRSTGSIDGVTPDYFYLALVDPSGQAFGGSGLPRSLTLSDFSYAFVGIDYGPLGTGNTDTIFFLSSLNTVPTPEPPTMTIVAIGLLMLAMGMIRAKQLRSCSKHGLFGRFSGKAGGTARINERTSYPQNPSSVRGPIFKSEVRNSTINALLENILPHKLPLLSALAICSSLLLGSCGGGSSPQPPPSNPVPAIQSITPGSASAGTNGFTLTINGSNFLASSVVSWNGATRQMTFVSSSELTAAISATDLAAQGMVQVAVANPAPGGGQSSTTFTISPPTAPIVTSVSPSTAIVGGSPFMLTVSGNNFVQNSVVQWNGSNRPTTYVSNSQLTAAIAASDIGGTVGNQPVSVSTPGTGGGNSNTVPVLVEYPLPAINALSPGQGVLGSGAFILNVSGTNFVNGATVYWNSIARVTQFVSSTQLTASILASDTGVAAGSNVSVTVQNPSPSAGVSNVQDFTLENPAPVLSSITPSSGPAGSIVSITVNGSGFVAGAKVQLAGQSLPTSYNSTTTVSAVVTSAPVGNFSLMVLNPPPNVGVSNSLLFDSTASGPGGQFVVATVDSSGAIIQSSGPLSPTGRYYSFGPFLRDTCLTASSGCVPSTITYGPNTNPTGISADGRYISSQVITGYSILSGDLEFSATCLGAPAGCAQTSVTLLPANSVYPGTSMSSDGRYILYGLGNSNPGPVLPLLVFDTCTGAPPGCTQTSVAVTSSAVNTGGWSLSADGRFIAYTRGQIPTDSTEGQITLNDSCLGAAPGCAPADVAMSASFSCTGAQLSSDALYLSYTCGGDAYLQNTCANLSSGCTPTSQHLTAGAGLVVSTAVSAGGRFVFFETDQSGTLSHAVYVYDSCNGAPSGCTVRAVPVCLAKDGSLANADCNLTGISDDGQYVAIYTQATNLTTLPSGVYGASYIWKNPLF